MSRKRRRQISVQTPSPTPDARREVAARASKALRSVEATKLRQDIINVYNNEVLNNVYHQVRKPRQFSSRKSVAPPVPRRSLPSNHELRNSGLRAQVRNELQDASRRLACYSRTSRREVLHALRKTGKAGRRNRKARWTEKSYMRCK